MASFRYELLFILYYYYYYYYYLNYITLISNERQNMDGKGKLVHLKVLS